MNEILRSENNHEKEYLVTVDRPITEAFLAKHLGGRYEPIGEAFTGSSLTAPTGADGVPGLVEKLGKK